MNAIKSLVKAITPTPIWSWMHRNRERVDGTFRLIAGYLYDLANFTRFSSAVVSRRDTESLRKRILKEYHVVEKGLSLPEPRPGFGEAAIRQMIEDIVEYEERTGPDEVTLAARSALSEYLEFNKFHQLDFPQIRAFTEVGQPPGPQDCIRTGGTIALDRSTLLRPEDRFFADFASRRYSIRSFTGEPVPMEVMLRAVEISLKTPSVCNRQTCRAYIITNRDLMAKALSHQNGNRGFGHTGGALYIITSDVRSFLYTGERNQGWIDGGLFSMSLAYAIHSLGYGSCMLNWSVEHFQDAALKRDLLIPSHDLVIMMMLVGTVPDNLRVAASHRKSLSDTAVVLDPNPL